MMKILDKYSSRFEILPSTQLSGYFQVVSNCNPSNISILIMKEIWATRESQDDWFIRMTSDVRNHTIDKILIIIFSNLDSDITDQRQVSYQSQIPNCIIKYLDFQDYWLPKDTDKLIIFDSIIDNFIRKIS